MKVAMIGTAPASRAVAPFDDPSWKIWACSQGNQGQLPRCDAWFELHPINALTGQEHRAWGVQYLGWLRAQAFPVYMQEKNDLVPGAIVFPWRRCIEKFGRNWFTSSIAWMMAYALLQMREGDEIGLFGIDMAAGEEHYTAQRAGLYRFIEIAKERGVSVHVPHESCLGQPVPLYAYAESSRMGRRLVHRSWEMEQAIAQMSGQRDKLNLEIAYAQGAKHNNDYIIRSFLDGVNDTEIVEEEPQVQATGNVIAGTEIKRPVMTGDVTEQRPSGLLVPKGTNGAHPPKEPN